jgi:diguanylate cyclase (GGDEF)-like protein
MKSAMRSGPTSFTDAVAVAGEGFLLVDSTGRIVAADEAADAWLAGSGSGSLGDVIGHATAADALGRVFSNSGDVAVEVAMPDVGQAERLVHLHMRRLAGPAGALALVTIHREPPTVIRDPLTGLADRRAITARIESWRGPGAKSPSPFAVLFVDLDDFKRINDEHGHAIGDLVLREAAQRLTHCVREGDLVARYGGDEFLLLLRDVASIIEAEPVVERLRQCTGEAIEVGDLRLHVSVTVGLAIADAAEQPIDELIAAADRDMYARKRRRPK